MNALSAEVINFTAMLSFENDIQQCLAVLQQGGTILYPTDTIWGIGADATDSDAVEKIIALKNRPENKSFVVLLPDARALTKYVTTLDKNIDQFLSTLIKPTTVIYEHATGLAANVMAENGSVAIRICKDEFCKHLIKRFGKPIVSTSANNSGQPAPALFSEIITPIIKGVDYVVKYRQTETVAAKASSIVQLKRGEIIVIRP